MILRAFSSCNLTAKNLVQATDHTAGNLCRKGTILWLLSCWPLYVIKLLNKHSPWLTPRGGETQCFGRLTATGASKEPGRNRKQGEKENSGGGGDACWPPQPRGRRRSWKHGSRARRFTWRCILLWFGMGCDCHAQMDPMHPTAVAAGGQ